MYILSSSSPCRNVIFTFSCPNSRSPWATITNNNWIYVCLITWENLIVGNTFLLRIPFVNQSSLVFVIHGPADTGILLWRTHARQKYPHICTLSINTGKNQSVKAQVIYILTNQYKYSVLHQYYITKGRNSMIYKEICKVQKPRDAHERQKRISRADQEGWKGRATDTLQPIHHVTIAPLWSPRRGHHSPCSEIWICGSALSENSPSST